MNNILKYNFLIFNIFVVCGFVLVGCASAGKSLTHSVIKVRYGNYISTGTAVSDTSILIAAHTIPSTSLKNISIRINENLPSTVFPIDDGWKDLRDSQNIFSRALQRERIPTDYAILQCDASLPATPIPLSTNIREDLLFSQSIFLITISKPDQRSVAIQVSKKNIIYDTQSRIVVLTNNIVSPDFCHLSGSPIVAVGKAGATIIAVASGYGDTTINNIPKTNVVFACPVPSGDETR